MTDRAVQRAADCFSKAAPVAFRTSLWFLKIMLPVSFLVMLLSHFGILPWLSSFTGPLFAWFGLPGDAALVFTTSIFTNNYTVIALMSGMPFTVREGIILAVMCLISHNYLVETLVQKKTGSSAAVMVALRLSCSFLAAFLLNLVLPSFPAALACHPVESHDFQTVLSSWVVNSCILSLKVVGIITGLMVLQRLLEEFGVIRILSSLFRPLMVVMGLPAKTAFLWLVGNTLGLAYGSAVLMEYAREGSLEKKEADLLNAHLAVSHSQLEDPFLFALLGLPVLWLIIPRFLLAVIVVWGWRLSDRIVGKDRPVKWSLH